MLLILPGCFYLLLQVGDQRIEEIGGCHYISTQVAGYLATTIVERSFYFFVAASIKCKCFRSATGAAFSATYFFISNVECRYGIYKAFVLIFCQHGRIFCYSFAIGLDGNQCLSGCNMNCITAVIGWRHGCIAEVIYKGIGSAGCDRICNGILFSIAAGDE
jgi:hypothetical protein